MTKLGISAKQKENNILVDFLADLCRSYLLDLGNKDLKGWNRLQSNAVDNLIFSFRVLLYTNVTKKTKTYGRLLEFRKKLNMHQ